MQETKQEFKVNQEVISFFEKLVNSGRSAKLELHGNSGFIELHLYDGLFLKADLALLRPLGIHKLTKGTYSSVTAQYASGATQDKKFSVWIDAKEDTFEGCKFVEVEEEVTVPATSAIEAVPEHKEIVKKKKIVCNGE